MEEIISSAPLYWRAGSASPTNGQCPRGDPDKFPLARLSSNIARRDSLCRPLPQLCSGFGRYLAADFRFLARPILT